MAKHRHLTKAAGKSNRGITLRPHKRIDIAKLPKREREALIAYAKEIQTLAELQAQENSVSFTEHFLEAAEQFERNMSEVRADIDQFHRYHETYPNEHPANAFTPLPRDFRRRQASKEALQHADAPVSVTHEKKYIRPGIELALITDEAEKKRIEAFAKAIFDLRMLQDDLGMLPPDLLGDVAEKYGYSKVWVSKSIERQREYCAQYPDHPYERAHTPKPVGRPKGRQSSSEVIEDIEKARINRKWLSRDGDGGYSEIESTIEKRLIHTLIEQKHGAVHSERTTYRIIKDYEERQAARVEVADEGDASVLQNHLPAIANRGKVRGPGERAQFDIRPLSIVVDNNGVACTAHAMLVIDDATERITSSELVFTKYVDENGEEHTQNFDDQICRATVARSNIEIGGRHQVYYADNGFRALRKYQHLLIAPEEAPTLIVYRRSGRPRGGGGIEVGVQLINSFLHTRPYYVRERDFRRSRKKKEKELTTADSMRADFTKFVWHWNNDDDPKGGLSRIARWNAGPNFALTAPSPTNLAMFALSQRRTTREPRQDPDCWFWLDNERYVAARPDPDLYERFAALSIRRSKLEAKKRQEADIKICAFDFGGSPPQKLVLFSLDNEETWELAVPATSRELSTRRHTDMMDEVERRLEHGDKTTLNDFFQQTILSSVTGPLVIDGLSRKRSFYRHEVDEPNADTISDKDTVTEAIESPSIGGGTSSGQSSASELSALRRLEVPGREEGSGESSESATTNNVDPDTSGSENGSSAESLVSNTRGQRTRKGTDREPEQPTSRAPSEVEEDFEIPNFIQALRRMKERQ